MRYINFFNLETEQVFLWMDSEKSSCDEYLHAESILSMLGDACSGKLGWGEVVDELANHLCEMVCRHVGVDSCRFAYSSDGLRIGQIESSDLQRQLLSTAFSKVHFEVLAEAVLLNSSWSGQFHRYLLEQEEERRVAREKATLRIDLSRIDRLR